MKKKIIFIHGYTASSKKDWYFNISKELDKLKVDYSIPDLPGGEYPDHRKWLKIIDREVKSTSKLVLLVGHSLGTRAVLLYLDQYKQSVETTILIAAFNNNWQNNRTREKGKYANFFEYSVDLKKIKNLAKKFIVIHSKDDDSIDYSQGVEIANQLGAKLITFKDRGHFHQPENAKYILEILKSLV